jgi:hypothetical protein
MGFYNDVIPPRLCDFAMRNKDLLPYRERARRSKDAALNPSSTRNVGDSQGLPGPRT